ncbi:MAG: hypothetical protein OXG98_11995, partial [Gemmatimonadetes bacterium]|nr:hypothetical protein [Gemmatimonadota bacterium]
MVLPLGRVRGLAGYGPEPPGEAIVVVRSPGWDGSGKDMDEIGGSVSAQRRTGRVAALLATAFLAASCGGEDTFLLTVFNALDSTETIRVDLAGDTRELGVGGYTEF